jgi:hypothetical protein
MTDALRRNFAGCDVLRWELLPQYSSFRQRLGCLTGMSVRVEVANLRQREAEALGVGGPPPPDDL